MAEIVQAAAPDRIREVRELILEYALTLSCEPCLQRIEEDVAHLPGEYAPPDGRLLLALDGGKPAGCVALRKIEEAVFEMRRLYVRRAFRGRKIGKALAEQCLKEARKEAGRSVRLYTLPSMNEAIHLYRSLGFRDIAPYGEHVIEGALYMELKL